MILDGQIVGSWKRIVKKDTITIKLSPFQSLSEREYEAFEQAVQAYAAFFRAKGVVITD